MRITSQFTVNPKAKKLSQKLRLSATGMNNAAKAIDKAISGEFDLNFKTSGSSGGPKWPPLKPATIKRKKQLGYSNLVLVASGALRSALNGTGDNHRSTVRIQNNNVTSFSVGITGKPGKIASYHIAGSGKLPVRNPMLIGESGKERIRKAVAQVVRKSIKDSFGLTVGN